MYSVLMNFKSVLVNTTLRSYLDSKLGFGPKLSLLLLLFVCVWSLSFREAQSKNPIEKENWIEKGRKKQKQKSVDSFHLTDSSRLLLKYINSVFILHLQLQQRHMHISLSDHKGLDRKFSVMLIISCRQVSLPKLSLLNYHVRTVLFVCLFPEVWYILLES